MEAYYRNFKAAISTSELENAQQQHTHNLKTNTQEPVNTMVPEGSSKYSSSCCLTKQSYEVCGKILKTASFWVQKITRRPQPPHMMFYYGTINQLHHDHTYHPVQWRSSK